MKIGIVGAGLAGLSVAFMLRNSSHCVEVFESCDRPGGLLRSERVDGWTFDIGGSHILFSRNSKTLAELLGVVGEYVGHRRRTFIFYRGRFIEYPFENGMYALPADERFEILRDFVSNLTAKKDKPSNLLEWFYYVFGKAITEKYLKPYNEKIWKRDLREISLDWVGGRVPNPPVDDVLRSAVGIRTEGYTHQLRFFYPLEGGIETLIANLAAGMKIRTDYPVTRIRLEDSKIVVNDESVFDRLVYTAPLSAVPDIFDECKHLRDDAKKLEYNSLTVFGFGIRGRVPNYHWVYVPQEDIIFHRVAFLSNYSPNMAPEGCSTVIVEISHLDKLGDVEDEVFEGLRKLGFEFNVEIVRRWEWKYAYVVYNHAYREAVSKIKKHLMDMNVIPFGRFGVWEYLNMDAVWEKAKNLVSKML